MITNNQPPRWNKTRVPSQVGLGVVMDFFSSPCVLAIGLRADHPDPLPLTSPPHPEEKATTAKSGGLVGGLLFQRVRPLDALAQRINEEQHQIEHHAKGMLLAAKAAGEALIEAKKMLPHGQFKAWVEVNTKVTVRMAQNYMRVAKEWDAKAKHVSHSDLSEASIRQFLELGQPKAPASNLPTFTEDDAEYALKIAARIDSEFEGEREVAKAKLEKLAKDHGMTSGELLGKARSVQPLNHLAEALLRRDQ